MNPFRMRIGTDVFTVGIKFGQVQHVAVRVLAGGHDARDHVSHVNVIRDAEQVFALADMNVRIAAHALDEEHVVPVPRKLPAVLFDQAAVAQERVHGIDVFK